jgi:hypothetical protein
MGDRHLMPTILNFRKLTRHNQKRTALTVRTSQQPIQPTHDRHQLRDRFCHRIHRRFQQLPKQPIALLQISHHQIILRRKVAIKGRLRHLGLGNDQVHPDRPNSLLVEELRGGVENTIAGIRGGSQVFFGARTGEKGQAIADVAGQGTQGGTNDEAAAFGAVLLYSVRGVDPAEVLTDTAVLTGKILIDPNNSAIPAEFAYEPIVKSLAETLAEQVPQAIVVKAFNTMAQEVFELAPSPLKAQRRGGW